jgi:NAD(P)-dependent dehydrogenase (short-subunit alcohol dehydrogenase family)
MGRLQDRMAIITGGASGIGAMAVFLASDESNYVTGGEFLVDGGMMAGHPGM